MGAQPSSTHRAGGGKQLCVRLGLRKLIRELVGPHGGPLDGSPRSEEGNSAQYRSQQHAPLKTTHGHRRLQWAGVGVMTFGLWLAWNHAAEAGGGAGISTRAFTSTAARAHAWAGWALCAVAWLQIAGGLARGSKGGPTDVQMRGDHYDMTPRRTSFERAHKALGWLAVVASMVVIALGLVVADAPRWMALVLALWWLVLAAVCAVLQQRGRCIDTYQAIWGPDPIHPGNRMSPVGWGVRRPLG